MYVSLSTFLANTARGNPILYGILVIAIIVLVALAIHRALEMLLKIFKL